MPRIPAERPQASSLRAASSSAPGGAVGRRGAFAISPAVESSEQALVAAARQGDHEAFAALYERYIDRVYDFARRMMGAADDAAEVARTTFDRALTALPRVQGTLNFQAWLFTIARNTALAELGRLQRTTALPAPGAEAEGRILERIDPGRATDVEAAAREQEQAALVWRAVASLKRQQYALLDLDVRQGLTSEEIAQVLGVTRGNAATTVSRLKEAVGSALSSYLLMQQGRRECATLDAELQRQRGAEMAPETRQCVESHVRTCATCQRVQKGLTPPLALLAILIPAPAPAEFRQSLLAELVSKAISPPPRSASAPPSNVASAPLTATGPRPVVPATPPEPPRPSAVADSAPAPEAQAPAVEPRDAAPGAAQESGNGSALQVAVPPTLPILPQLGETVKPLEDSPAPEGGYDPVGQAFQPRPATPAEPAPSPGPAEPSAGVVSEPFEFAPASGELASPAVSVGETSGETRSEAIEERSDLAESSAVEESIEPQGHGQARDEPGPAADHAVPRSVWGEGGIDELYGSWDASDPPLTAPAPAPSSGPIRGPAPSPERPEPATVPPRRATSPRVEPRPIEMVQPRRTERVQAEPWTPGPPSSVPPPMPPAPAPRRPGRLLLPLGVGALILALLLGALLFLTNGFGLLGESSGSNATATLPATALASPTLPPRVGGPAGPNPVNTGGPAGGGNAGGVSPAAPPTRTPSVSETPSTDTSPSAAPTEEPQTLPTRPAGASGTAPANETLIPATVTSTAAASPNGGIRGLVTCDGQAQGGVPVTVRGPTSWQGFSGANGRFDTNLTLKPGRYTVVVSFATGTDSAVVDVTAGNVFDLQLKCPAAAPARGGGVRGTVSCQGRGVGGVTVSVRNQADSTTVTSSTNGAYDTGLVLAPGSYTVTAVFQNGSRSVTVTVTSGSYSAANVNCG